MTKKAKIKRVWHVRANDWNQFAFITVPTKREAMRLALRISEGDKKHAEQLVYSTPFFKSVEVL